ncbi:MAG: hypothetical protein ACMV0F_01875 [Trichlorobacter sp.]
MYTLTRLKRLMIIYNVVQVGLLGLLLFMSYNFIVIFGMYSLSGAFSKSILFALALQLLIVYPAWLLAKQDVQVEIQSAKQDLNGDEMMALRKKRLIGDIWKLCALGAFVVFIAMSPGVDKGRGASVILATSYFSFLLTAISYFQCFNYVAKRQIRSLT